MFIRSTKYKVHNNVLPHEATT